MLITGHNMECIVIKHTCAWIQSNFCQLLVVLNSCMQYSWKCDSEHLQIILLDLIMKYYWFIILIDQSFMKILIECTQNEISKLSSSLSNFKKPTRVSFDGIMIFKTITQIFSKISALGKTLHFSTFFL